MAKKRTDIDTKQLLYKNAQHLFYEKGYADTTYDEIACSIGLTPPMLRYHFGNKGSLASIIYHNFHMKLHNEVIRISNNKLPSHIQIILSEFVLFDLICKNTYLQRFFVDLCKAGIINDYTRDTTFFFNKQYLIERCRFIPDDEIELNSIITIAAQSRIIYDYFTGRITLDFDSVLEKYVHLCFYFNLDSEQEIDDNIKICRDFISGYDISMTEDFSVKIEEKK